MVGIVTFAQRLLRALALWGCPLWFASSGCSSYPQARYHSAATRALLAEDVLLPFALQASLVTIATAPTPGQLQEEKGRQPQEQLAALGLAQGQKSFVTGIQGLRKAQAFAVQMEAMNSLFLLEPDKSFLTESDISVTYYDGHHTMKAIGTEFQDNRIKAIEAVGGIIAASVALVGLAEAPETEDRLELPLVVDFTDPSRFNRRDIYSEWQQLPNHTRWWYRYKVSKPLETAISTDEFFRKRKGLFTRYFPVSACADMVLEIGIGGAPADAQKETATYALRVADPSYVEPLPFPRKGSITMHTVCGADLSVQSSPAGSTFAVLESVAKQVEAVLKAQQKTGDGGEKKPDAKDATK